ncbi:MAG TPA: LysR family transcriptional regulator [Gemmataceae bacterium]|nr:LysR family transcriptional regulator [Gemmataceae bacterium]
MELRHLRYMLAVAEEGSFSHAAARLRVAQQALSKQIADLESELGVQLFLRTARGVTVSPAAAEFLDEARSILAMSARATEKVRSSGPRGRERIRIGMSQMQDYYNARVAAALNEFRRSNPSVAIQVLQMSPAAQLDCLHAGTLDVGIVHSPPDNSGAIDGTVLGQQSIDRVLISIDHPVAKRKKLELRDLHDFPYLTFPREVNPLLYDHLLNSLGQRGLTPTMSIISTVGTPSLVIPFVSGTDLWTLYTPTPDNAVSTSKTVTTKLFADEPIFFCAWLLSRRDTGNVRVAEFISLCKSTSHMQEQASMAAT